MIPVPSDSHSTDGDVIDGSRALKRVAVVTTTIIIGVALMVPSLTSDHDVVVVKAPAAAAVRSMEHEHGVPITTAAPLITDPPTEVPQDIAEETQSGRVTSARPRGGATKLQSATFNCPALGTAIARRIVETARWSYDTDLVKQARSIEQPVAPSADDGAPAPAHEAAAPVLDVQFLAGRTVGGEIGDAVVKKVKGTCSVASANALDDRMRFRRFDRMAAHRCLSGKYLLFYGNSNTRTLYTALEALLRGTRQVGRVLAKQMCDNSKKNHSCSTVVDPPSGGEDGEGVVGEPVKMFYWGYVKDFYHPSLVDKMKRQFAMADAVVGNAGVNVIQGTPDGRWEAGFGARPSDKLESFFGKFTRPDAQAWWHTTTPLCDHQPHFTKYKYSPKYWSGRSLASMNKAIAKSNDLASDRIASMTQVAGGVVGVLDDGALVPPTVCKHYDDPLHHRFLDRELVQVLLNAWCPME